LKNNLKTAEKNLARAKHGQNAVERAVLAVGGPTKAARICGVSNAAVHKWIQRGSISLLRNALRLSRASGVSIEEFVDEE
jgi:DNA-binding transcriptional regulator YdaS (Cro superfamily)